MRVLIADIFSKPHAELLISSGFVVKHDTSLTNETLAAALVSFDPQILIVRGMRVQEAQFSAGKSLEAVVLAGSGHDRIDKVAASAKGVFVANCPGKNASATAELAFALILAIDRRVIANDRELKQGKWNKGEYTNCKGLKGRTLGIIGYGNIGKEVARRALGFEMNVLVVSRNKPEIEDMRVKTAENLEELLKKSDVVSLHLPNMPQPVVNSEFLKKMKRDAALINTARGTLVDEKALLLHLEENPEFYCGLDGFADEPVNKNDVFSNELGKHPRVIATQHIGGSTKQAEYAIGQEVYQMLIEYKRSGIIPNCVNVGNKGKCDALSVKYENKPEFFAGLYAVLAKGKGRVMECKSEVFDGGNTGVLKVRLEECGEERKKEIEEGVKELREVISFKWD